MAISRIRALALVPALLFGAGCQYTKDRTLDFLDQGSVYVGLGSTVGARGEAWGLVDTGLMVGVKPKSAALGWRYGQPLFFNESDARWDIDQAEIVWTTSVVDLDYAKGSYASAKNSVAVLPALLSWVDATPTGYEWEVPEDGADFVRRNWIWSSEAMRRDRYSQIHAFDIEWELALLVYAGAGFSPGEMVDFWLGLATIDIARDDGRW